MENNKLFPGILTFEVKRQLNTISGQINAIICMLDKGKDPEIILTQMRTANNALDKAFQLLVDEVFCKVLATNIVDLQDQYTTDCDNEKKIELIRQKFPEVKLDELIDKLNEIGEIELHLGQLDDQKKKFDYM